ncbi:primary-amine oxidase [Saccharopolyspora karakumensis]|uniref:Amine oxidase n=1 Tax=Saccharopolyspora karakumensis TaxID=2530386 RepID=A0A4V2YX41_9PSEU|nr:primary-amine oxidase [Saccharopolyspora karakumensis]TDD87877.1 primary-amine oxidase [Saccharopolyspora karakumensis]
MTIAEQPATTTAHPLDPMTAEEVTAVRAALDGAGLLGENVRFTFVTLEEPDRDAALAHRPGQEADRRFRAVLLDLASGVSHDTVVSATRSTVDSVRRLDPAVDGQPPIIDTEFELVEEIVNADERWTSALRKRGIDPATVRAAPLSAGVYDEPGERGKRIIRSLGFQQFHPADHPWAHPVDGLCAYIDLTNREVTRIVDHRELPVPQESGNFDDPEVTGPARTSLRPIEITQPEGPSFTVEGHRVRWENWDLRLGFNEREGLTLHQLSFHQRQVLHRASIAEMVVPYADPSPVRFWQNYFDCGEYMFARYTNSLELGCDCLGEIHYFDAVVADDFGRPRTIRNGICMHEEDYGVLWKHTDLFTGSQETRRQRRLVISFFTTVGNYDYGFYWYFYLDGTIQLECKATGITFTAAYPDEGHEYATQIAPGLGAPFHQHLFCARLDVAVDGQRNAVEEVEAERVPVSETNPRGNAFRAKRTRLRTEGQAARLADNSRARTWHIVNPGSQNRYGDNVSYVLHPEGRPVMLADESASVHARGTFATKHLWVTRYDREQRYPAGDLVNQNPGGAGLPAWTARDRDIDGQDIVVWHTFGLTHFPRPEDWPIMPVDRAGFTLTPVGFFDRNPTLDVPRSTGTGCHGEGSTGL